MTGTLLVLSLLAQAPATAPAQGTALKTTIRMSVVQIGSALPALAAL